MNPKNYGGIDVAKKNFVIGIYGQDKTKTEANTPKGHAKAVEYLQKHNVDLVVLESTGGLEVPLANALHAADIRVVIANPQRTHQYAASFSLGKTDHLDAKMLADYAQALDSERWPMTCVMPRRAKKRWRLKHWSSVAASWLRCAKWRKTASNKPMPAKKRAWSR